MDSDTGPPQHDQFNPSLYSVPGPICTTQPLTATIAGVEHNLGSAISYLMSARAEGDPDAEPGLDGTIAVTLVPGENNHAIRCVRELSTDEVADLIARALAARASGR